MAQHALKQRSAYAGSCIILPTKHGKSAAIAPAFRDILGANILEYTLDTDVLGTFSGEVERKASALECARQKCEWALELLGDKAEFALASEGSFGPHPFIPFLPGDQEILYFIDRRRGFHLHLSHISENTNYRTQAVDSPEALHKLARDVQFPSHALVLRPNAMNTNALLFKGIDSQAALEDAYTQCLKHSNDGKVWVQTDMRALCNPTRMHVIGELAARLALRLAAHCPKCNTPGWGKVRVEKVLHCEVCDQETSMNAHEIYGCVLCDHTEKHSRPDGLTIAPQMHCEGCNP